MSTSLSRRAWFKSALVAGAAMPLGLSLVQELMAAPASQAEAEFLASLNGKLVRLGSNENPYGPSPKAREAIQRAIVEGNRYPFDQSAELKELLAAHEGVSPDHIFLAAGSGEVAGRPHGIEFLFVRA